jgi:hypothetical protein
VFRPKAQVRRPKKYGMVSSEYSLSSLHPLALVFNCFSKAGWELQTDVLKLRGSYKQHFKTAWKQQAAF